MIISTLYSKQGWHGHEKPGKVMEFLKWLFPGLEK